MTFKKYHPDLAKPIEKAKEQQVDKTIFDEGGSWEGSVMCGLSRWGFGVTAWSCCQKQHCNSLGSFREDLWLSTGSIGFSVRHSNYIFAKYCILSY